MLDLFICMFHVLRLPEFQGIDKRGLVTTVVFCGHKNTLSAVIHLTVPSPDLRISVLF
jgi:hypothetical protein